MPSVTRSRDGTPNAAWEDELRSTERTSMVAHETTDELREDLRRVEADLAVLRTQVAQLRRAIGERWDAPRDNEDLSAMLTTAEEQEAVIAVLEARCEALLRRLGEEV
jgi:hypothetical protein